LAAISDRTIRQMDGGRVSTLVVAEGCFCAYNLCAGASREVSLGLWNSRTSVLQLPQDPHHLILAGSLLITAAPALLTTSSWESVPPEQPIAPIIAP
jgi:hypothetical protein